jgi:Lipocalin-like domain
MKQFCLGIIVAIGLTLPAFGQGTLKEQLVGAWALVSCDGFNGVKLSWCASPNGIHILDASGHYATVNAARGRPKFTDAARPPDALWAEEYKAAAVGLQAQFGTWSVNEADKTITYHVEGALFQMLKGWMEKPPSASPEMS